MRIKSQKSQHSSHNLQLWICHHQERPLPWKYTIPDFKQATGILSVSAEGLLRFRSCAQTHCMMLRQLIKRLINWPIRFDLIRLINKQQSTGLSVQFRVRGMQLSAITADSNGRRMRLTVAAIGIRIQCQSRSSFQAPLALHNYRSGLVKEQLIANQLCDVALKQRIEDAKGKIG